MAELRQMVSIDDNTKQRKGKNPEFKTYLLCVTGKEGYEDYWEIIEGRSNVYEHIKNNAEFIDVENSFVLVEGLALEKRASIYQFMKHCENFFNDSFDIEDYVYLSNISQDRDDYTANIDSDMTNIASEWINATDITSGNINMNELK